MPEEKKIQTTELIVSQLPVFGLKHRQAHDD